MIKAASVTLSNQIGAVKRFADAKKLIRGSTTHDKIFSRHGAPNQIRAGNVCGPILIEASDDRLDKVRPEPAFVILEVE